MVQHIFYSQHASGANGMLCGTNHISRTNGNRLTRCLCLSLLLMFLSSVISMTASAVPNTTPKVTVINNETTTDPSTNPSTNDLETFANQQLSDQQPSESKLSAANQTLLTQNAKLQREVNDLQTQVNVLVHERSGQLYLYGVFTVIVSLLVGFGLGLFVFRQRERW